MKILTAITLILYSGNSVACDIEVGKFFLETKNLETWDKLYKSHKSHPRCNDGVFGQTYSDVVVKLLVKTWPDLDGYKIIINNEPDFKKWVIPSVNETVADSDIKFLSEQQCEIGDSFCEAIVNRAKRIKSEW